jgi:hypothetical protein
MVKKYRLVKAVSNQTGGDGFNKVIMPMFSPQFSVASPAHAGVPNSVIPGIVMPGLMRTGPTINLFPKLNILQRLANNYRDLQSPISDEDKLPQNITSEDNNVLVIN